jgi:predicted dinucleotide-binding enzyme
MPSPVCIVGATGARGAQVPEGTFSGAENPEALQACEIVIPSVPFSSQVETFTSLPISISGRNKVRAGIRITGLPA